MTVAEKVSQFRRSTLTGLFVDLVPQELRHSAAIVRLRNQAQAQYFLNQDHELSVSEQETWQHKYERSTDDVGFTVLNKRTHEVIGNLHMYDITDTDAIYGRAVFDLVRIHGTMQLMEANMLALEASFTQLGLQVIYTSVKEDNFRLQKFHSRMGFLPDGDEIIRGCRYVKLKMPVTNQLYLDYKPLVAERAQSLQS